MGDVSSPDAGAREIRRLLTTPDPSLASALRALVTALRHGLKPSHRATPGVTISPATAQPVRHIRAIYRDLRTQVAAIDTKQQDAKRRVLNALDLVDSSLALFARSLTASSDRSIAELARQAYWRREHAHAELSRAVRELR
jgi:hypothetical protein